MRSEEPHKKGVLSIILLSYFSGSRIRSNYIKIRDVLGCNNIQFEYIVMDDGSQDNSFEVACELEKEFDNVRAFKLSRNYTSHYSIFAGLSVSHGACAIPIPDDEQQPMELLVTMYREWQRGHKIVVPHRISREDPLCSKIFSNLYYMIMNGLSDVKYPKGGADSFLIDREIIDLLNTRIHPINTTSISEVLRLGFDPLFMPYDRPEGLGKGASRWTWRKKIKLARDSFFSSSDFPIRFISGVGFLCAILSVFLSCLYIYIALFGNRQFWGVRVPGWTSIILAILFFSGVILLSLGVIAEYIWRIYEEVKARPGFIIRQRGER